MVFVIGSNCNYKSITYNYMNVYTPYLSSCFCRTGSAVGINPRPRIEWRVTVIVLSLVCLLTKFQRTYEHWHFENTTSRCQIIQGSKVTIDFC